MGLTAVGLGSGLDINGIVKALVDTEKLPKEASLNSKEATVQAEISAVGSIKSAMTTFQDSLEKLSDPTEFNQRKVSRNQVDFLSAKADDTAVTGSYNVVVEQLAENQKVGSGPVADVTTNLGAGSLDLDVNGKSFSVSVDADDSLQDVMKKINNSEDNVGITATIVTDDTGSRLVMSSDKTGTENQITVTASGDTSLTDVFNATTEIQPAKDAIVTIDGLKVTSSSNTLDKAIQGVTLDLTKADVGESTKITISNDDDAVIKNIEAFVEAYNEMMTTVSNLSAYDPNTKTSGALQGDALPRAIQSQMRGLLGNVYDTSDGPKSLSMFGVSSDRYGKLEIDDDKLKESVKDNGAALAEMFTKEDTGLTSKLDSAVDAYVQAGGIIASRDTTLKNQLERIADDRTSLATRMKSYENRLYKQFNAMDAAVASLNSQSADLAARFDALPGFTKKS
ncbi:flagellar filament capping protein FliD [Ferrimonas sp. SCSIO 43195]|uniref:flagellar filament capping protein FliD n=1 Tax=Ferrimonas sp. SCSIO 43195 TaxID=2822844 RepID=UPI0020765760|nr:flagellar filament capping protein FliD [Ferrimonas sp. SCSIO 43195]USD38619.1 flagellar filament capping protein FliD [Ferrimonas sp. SCSIO 43195]